MASNLQDKWQQRIHRACKVREEWCDQFKVELARDFFEGRQNPGHAPEEWITLNKIYSHLQAQLPMLYSMDPYFYVKLKRSFVPDPQAIVQMEQQAKGRQAMLNYLKTELKMKEKARLGIQDAHFAYGVLKTRRASDQKEHPHAGQPILDEEGNPTADESGEAMVYPDYVPANERYEFLRIHPDDIVWDEDAGALEDSWNWLAQRIRMTKADALKDPRFSARVIRSISGRGKDDGQKEKRGFIDKVTGAFKKKTDKDDWLTIWEIYDIKGREFLMIAEDAEDVLVKPRGLPPGVEKHPFSFLRFTLRDKSPYPIPPVFPGIDPQREYNLSRSRILTHRKRFNRKYEVDVNKLSGDADAEIARLETGDDGTCIRVIAQGAVNPVQDAPLDQQTYQELMLLNNDLVEILGSPDNSRGIASADSATEASLLDRRLEVREGDRMSMVVDWILEAARKLDQLVQAHIDKNEAVKITGPGGDEWVSVLQTDYENVQGEYQYVVNVGASQPRLPDIERSQWIAFLSQVVVPFPQILTAPRMMKRMAEMFHIEDEAAVEEMRQLGLQMMSGQLPMPGNTGGGPSNNPIAAVLGSALGQSGGNANGGGAQV